ncbi:MAG: metal ABC transporter permease [Alphaproteobacteria bacterium]|tara:strand:+ start:297 stop:1100 length:804 start_codon:yes stop_codon:yes gene_type:complete
MFDDFFIRALIAGIGIAIVVGPLGCFVIWRRLSYFGDTLSHSALLGVTLAYSFSVNISLSVFVVSAVVALLLINLQKRTKLAGDSLLGLLAHSTLAIGLVLIGFLSYIRFDLMGLLFGDILAVTIEDIALVWVGGFVILGILYFIWKSLFSATVNYDLSAAEGMKPEVSNFIFTLLLAGVIAISIKMIGALLITGLLLIPAATARNISNSPNQMVFLATLVGIISVIAGLFTSLELNTSSGPTIIVVALILFIISLVPLEIKGQLQK